MITLGAAFFAGACLVNLVWWQVVPTQVMAEDRAALRQIVAPTYADEIELIRLVQQRVLAASPIGRGIQTGQPRERAHLQRAGKGLSYDRSPPGSRPGTSRSTAR